MNKHEYVPIKLRLGRQVVGQIQPPGWNLLLLGRIVGVLLADSLPTTGEDPIGWDTA